MENKSEIIIYQTDDGKTNVSLMAKDGNIWMNQNQIAELFDTSKQTISYHTINILEEKELDANSVVKDYLTTAIDGKNYEVTFYSLDMILSIGFRVRSKRGTQFRIWANKKLKEYMIKATQMFFAETQNKLLYAVTNKTAAELIISRADAQQPNMALTSWKGNKVRKQDILIAKNYLQKNEIDQLNRLTIIFLETAELRVQERKDLTLAYWQNNVNKLLEFNEKKILQGIGNISHKQMEKKVYEVYEEFNQKRKEFEAQQADLDDLKILEETIKQRDNKNENKL